MNTPMKFVAPLLISVASVSFADAALAGPLPSQHGLFSSDRTETMLEAVQYRRGGAWRGGGYRRGGGGGWIGPAIIGGAIIGGAIAASRPYGYYGDGYGYGPGPGYVYAPAPAYAGNAAAYCAQRFRSWDPATGTYLGYDGLRHPCP